MLRRFAGFRPASRLGAVLVAVMALLGASPVVLLPGRADAAPSCGAATVTIARKSGAVLYLESGSSPALDSAYALYKITNTSGSAYPDLWVSIGSFAGPAIGLASTESGRAHVGSLAAGASANAAFYLTAGAVDASPESHTVSVYTTRPDLSSSALCTSSFTMTAADDISASANKVTSVSSSASPQLGGRLVVTVGGNTGTIGAAGLFTATPASYATWPANAYRLIGSTLTMSGGNNGTYTDTLFLSGLNSSATDYTAQFTFAVVGTTGGSTTVSPMTHISSGTQVKHTTTNNFGSLSGIPNVVNSTTLTVSGSPSSLPSTGGTITYTATITNAGSASITLDDLTVTLPANTTYVPGSSTFGGSATADPAISGGTAAYLSGLIVPAGTSRTLTLQVTVPGVSGNYAASVTGHVASVTIDTTSGTGDSQPATGSITVIGPPPVVTSVSPATGPAAGGTAITITGSNFTGATAVHIGATAISGFTVVNGTTITATTPVGSGALDVTVTTPSGTSATGAADVFTYAAPPPAPNPPNLTSTGTGTTPQTATITIPSSGSATLLTTGGTPTASPVTITGQGTYTLAGTTITFTPVLGYAGTATAVAYRITDAYAQHGDALYTPTVNAPTAPSPPALTSTGVGTTPQTATITIPSGANATLLTVGGTPTASAVTVTGQGTYTRSEATITFTPVNGYTGTATPVTYRITDAYAQTGDATYTPTVTAIPVAPPTPPDLTSTGVGPAAQSVTVTIPSGGGATLLTAGGTPTASPVTITGQGTYTLAATTITFTPLLGYAGTATAVAYRITDSYAQTGDAHYTPTVTAPAAPSPPPLTSTGDGTSTQSVTVTVPSGGSLAVMDAGSAVTDLTVGGTGVFHAGTTALTFTPEPGYAGTVAVMYRIRDTYGQSGTATYTITVTLPPPPTAPDRSTTGVGTTPQNAALPFPDGGTITLLDAGGNPVSRLTIAGKGTYVLSLHAAGASVRMLALARTAAATNTATVTFTAVLGYTGIAPPIRYRVTDAYGQTAIALYTPTVTLPAAPPAAPKTSSGNRIDPQHVALAVPAGGTIALLDSAGLPTTTLVVAGQGTYTLDSVTGHLSFTPEAGFTGTPAPVRYRVTDAYGQTATATYTPSVVGGSGPGELPVTGPDASMLAELGLFALVCGLFLVRVRAGGPSRTVRRG